MARADHRELKDGSEFEAESGKSSSVIFVATIPLAVVLVMFVWEAYQRPAKPFYNLPSGANDDAMMREAAEASGSLVPLMDMCCIVLSFSIFWSVLCCYFLGFLRAWAAMIEHYLSHGASSLGNLVYEKRNWVCEFQYYGYCSYQHPDNPGVLIRKRVRIFEPYTRELVPVICLPGYPKSGQGKEDLEYASLLANKNRRKEILLGSFSLAWTVVCILVAVYILHQMSVINKAEYMAGLTEDYDNVDKGWRIFWMFMLFGIAGPAIAGTALAWLLLRWWMLYNGTLSEGELSIHGFDDDVVVETQSHGQYQRMSTTTDAQIV